jgi:hypothetical protein
MLLWDTFRRQTRDPASRHGSASIAPKKQHSHYFHHIAKNPLTTTCEDHHGIQLDPSCNSPTFGSSLMKIMIMAALGVV